MYGDTKYQDKVKQELYEAIWNAQNILGEYNTAEIIFSALEGNLDELTEVIQKKIDTEL